MLRRLSSVRARVEKLTGAFVREGCAVCRSGGRGTDPVSLARRARRSASERHRGARHTAAVENLLSLWSDVRAGVHGDRLDAQGSPGA